MSEFIFSVHARQKFIFFKKHKINISSRQVKDTVLKGKVADTSELPATESTHEFDEMHSLVVIL